jgi:hypothetical protein
MPLMSKPCACSVSQFLRCTTYLSSAACFPPVSRSVTSDSSIRVPYKLKWTSILFDTAPTERRTFFSARRKRENFQVCTAAAVSSSFSSLSSRETSRIVSSGWNGRLVAPLPLCGWQISLFSHGSGRTGECDKIRRLRTD